MSPLHAMIKQPYSLCLCTVRELGGVGGCGGRHGEINTSAPILHFSFSYTRWTFSSYGHYSTVGFSSSSHVSSHLCLYCCHEVFFSNKMEICFIRNQSLMIYYSQTYSNSWIKTIQCVNALSVVCCLSSAPSLKGGHFLFVWIYHQVFDR